MSVGGKLVRGMVVRERRGGKNEQQRRGREREVRFARDQFLGSRWVEDGKIQVRYMCQAAHVRMSETNTCQGAE